MDSETIEHIVARKEYSRGLIISPHRLLTNYKERKKSSFIMGRSG